MDIVFYDVTTFAFQSVEQDDLRDFGFSKVQKFKEVQVVLGLFIDGGGLPVGCDLFPGNTCDGRTLVSALERLRGKFDVRRVIIVADRGINSKNNLYEIKKAGYEYIVADRQSGALYL
jgi:transposase